MFYLALEIFNPLQGNILVGIAGAMYFLVPMSWCFLGLLMTREDIARIFKIIIFLGLITALYGLYQHFFGLSAVEIYELKAKQFYKTFGGERVRIMSTFASLGDFSGYLQVAAYLSFAMFWRTKKNLLLVFIAILEVYTMVWMAVRTAFLLLAFSITILLVVKGKNRRQVVLRGALAVFLFVAVYGILGTYSPEKIYDQQFSTNPYVVHTLSGVTHPTQESSFKGRLTNWKFIVSNTLTQYWVGHGLGSTTVAAKKFEEGQQQYETDSYFFELFYGSGLLAPILFSAVVFICLKNLLTMCIERPDVYEYQVAIGLLCGAILGSVFGLTLRDIITGPFLWLVVGWTLKEDLDGRWSRAAAVAQPR